MTHDSWVSIDWGGRTAGCIASYQEAVAHLRIVGLVYHGIAASLGVWKIQPTERCSYTDLIPGVDSAGQTEEFFHYLATISKGDELPIPTGETLPSAYVVSIQSSTAVIEF